MKQYFLLFCVLCVLYQSGSIFAQSVYNLMPQDPSSNSGAPQSSKASATALGTGSSSHSQWKRIQIDTSDVDLYNTRKHCARQENKKEWKWYSRWSNALRNHEDKDSYCDSCYFNKYEVVFTEDKKKYLKNHIIPAIVNHFATKGPLVRHQSTPLDLTYEWNKRSNPCRMFARPQSHDTTPMDNANIMMYVAAMPFTDSSSVWGSRCIVRDGRTVAIALNFNPCYLNFGEEVLKNAISVVSQLLWSSTAHGSDVLALPRQFGLYDYPILAEFDCTRDRKVMVRFEKENVWKHCSRNNSYLYGKQFPVSCPKFTDVCSIPTPTRTLTVSQSHTLSDSISLIPKEIKKPISAGGVEKLTETVGKAKEEISTPVGKGQTEKQETKPEIPTTDKQVVQQRTEGTGSDKGTQSEQRETEVSGDLTKGSEKIQTGEHEIKNTAEDTSRGQGTHTTESKSQLKDEGKKEPELSGHTGQGIQNPPTVSHDEKTQKPQEKVIKPNEGPTSHSAVPVKPKDSSDNVDPSLSGPKSLPPSTDTESDDGAHSSDASDSTHGKDANAKDPVKKVSGSAVRDLKNVTFQDSGSVAFSTWQFALLSLFMFAMMCA